MTGPNVVERLKAAGRVHEAFAAILGVPVADVSPTRTTAIRCRWHDDDAPSFVLGPDAATASCRSCGVGFGLLGLGVACGYATTEAAVAARLAVEVLGDEVPRPETSNGHVPSETAPNPWPRFPNTAARVGWQLGEENGRVFLRVPTTCADGRPGRTKVRYEKRGGAPAGRFESDAADVGWIGGADVLAHVAAAVGESPLVLVAMGETDFLALTFAAARERIKCAVLSSATGETTSFGPECAPFFRGARVVLVGDADTTGRREAPKRAAEVRSLGAVTAAYVFPTAGKDASDYVLADGRLRDLLALAETPAAQGTASATALKRADLSEIRVRDEFSPVVEESIAALMASGGDGLFVRGRTLVRVLSVDPKERAWLRRAPGAPVIAAVTPANLRERLDQAARWTKVDGRRKGIVPALPPEWVASAVLERGAWPFPNLVGVVAVPTLRPDGSILDLPGYDEATGLLYVPTVEVPAVPIAPSQADTQKAAELLLDPFRDFPFRGRAARAAVLAAVLSLVGRAAIDGPVPMFGVSAPSPGSGKDLLVNAVSIIGAGCRAASMVYTQSDEELRKRILAVALEGDSVVSLGNVEVTLGSDSLAHALTADEWKDRHLGLSKMASAPLRAVWFATGNNLRFSKTVGRRVVPIDLDPQMENPEDRREFTYPALLAHIESVRPSLVCAALTVWRAFFQAGRPKHGGPQMGSFESWDSLVRSCCVWLGFADPAAVTDPESGRGRLRAESDDDRETMVELLVALRAKFRDGQFTASEVLAATAGDPGLGAAVAGACPQDGKAKARTLDARAIGNVFKAIRDRPAHGHRLVRAGNARAGAAAWLVSVSHPPVDGGRIVSASGAVAVTSATAGPGSDSPPTHPATCHCGEPVMEGDAECAFHADRENRP